MNPAVEVAIAASPDPIPISSSAELYQNSLLSSRHFRVLTLDPGSKSNRIRCTLHTCSLDGQMPEYEALSYTWGNDDNDDPTPEGSIFVNNTRMEVRKNLLAALQDLRQERASTTLWIDAICINQGDPADRSHQVKLMPDIYKNASRVIAWLGPKSRYSDKAMVLLHQLSVKNSQEEFLFHKFIKRRPRDILEIREFVKSPPIVAAINSKSPSVPYDDESWLGVPELLHHRWFYRGWILQEIVLAKDAIFRSGNKKVTVDELAGALHWINRHRMGPNQEGENKMDKLFYDGFHQSLGTLITRNEYLKDGKICLISLLCDSWVRKCGDPRDYIYSLLRVADAPPISVDYELPVVNFYQEFATTLIEASKSLDILRMRQHPAIPGLPSWVPDWTTKSGQNPPSPRGLYHAAGNSKAMASFGSSAYITLQGIVIDVVAFMGVVAKVGDDVSSTLRTNWEYVAYREGSLDRSAIVDPECVRNPDYICGGSKKEEAFARALVADRWSDNRWPADDRVRDLLYESGLLTGSARPGVEPTETTQSNVSRFLIALEQEVRERRLFVTTNGYIGLAPPSTEERDLVCVLLGGDVPFISRPCNNHYSLVGEAYIHGIMDGEGVQKTDACEFEDFDIY